MMFFHHPLNPYTISAQELVSPLTFRPHQSTKIWYLKKNQKLFMHTAPTVCVLSWFHGYDGGCSGGGDGDDTCDGTPSSSKLLFPLKIERRKKTFPFLTQHKSYYSKDFIFFVFIPLLSEDVELHWIINKLSLLVENIFFFFHIFLLLSPLNW